MKRHGSDGESGLLQGLIDFERGDLYSRLSVFIGFIPSYRFKGVRCLINVRNKGENQSASTKFTLIILYPPLARRSYD